MRTITIAKTLVRERHKKGISQEELAGYMGVSKAAVSKWENEQSFPDIMLLPELATFFNISLDELMGYQPQLTKEEIRKQYYNFAKAFEEEAFENVFKRCQGMIRKYYSCYPFLLQMAILLLNHATNSSNPQQVMDYTIELLQKVKKESEEPDDVKDAISVEASCYLLMNQPQKALELVNEQVRPLSQETELLSQIYQRIGNVEKAKEVTQIALYQHLLLLIGDGAFELLLYVDEYAKAEEIMNRIDGVSEIFRVNNLHPNVMASYYISCAMVCGANGKEDRALKALEKYVDLCSRHFFPLLLHGDSFFDRIESWFQEFELGQMPPRGEKFVKQSMVQAMCENPGLLMLKENPEFLKLEKRLKRNLETESEGEEC